MNIPPDTSRCHACGRRYEITNHKDRCPVCCPKEEPEEAFEDYELADDDYGDDLTPERFPPKKGDPKAAYLDRDKLLSDDEQ